MNWSSAHHRVDALWPELVLEARIIAVVPQDQVLAMTTQEAVRALFSGCSPCPQITETLHGEFQTSCVIRPSNIIRLLESWNRSKYRRAAT